jgi:3-dehydroquinate dehydratase-2
MSDNKKRLVVLHGANLNLLGERPAVHYGTVTLAGLEDMVAAEADRLGWGCLCLQTNHEGQYIEHPLQLCDTRCVGTGSVPHR